MCPIGAQRTQAKLDWAAFVESRGTIEHDFTIAWVTVAHAFTVARLLYRKILILQKIESFKLFLKF